MGSGSSLTRARSVGMGASAPAARSEPASSITLVAWERFIPVDQRERHAAVAVRRPLASSSAGSDRHLPADR
jgi:hypothetical protein